MEVQAQFEVRLKAFAQPARYATVIQRTGLISYCMKIQNTVNFSRQLPLNMPVVQEPLRGEMAFA